jgi:hypothetical protein
VIALLGLAATPAPAASSAPAITSTVPLIGAWAVVVAALVGVGAAIVAQIVAQAATTRRETAARRLREARVRKLFAARVKTLAFHFGLFAYKRNRPELSIEEIATWIRNGEETFELLAREFAIFELSLALETEAIESFGLNIPKIKNLIGGGKDVLEGVRVGGTTFDDGREWLAFTAEQLVDVAYKMLDALGEQHGNNSLRDFKS